MVAAQPNTIIFDFDGVILDSAERKAAAFAALYEAEEPALQDRVRDLAQRISGLSRQQCIALFERTVFEREPSAERIERLARRYGEIVAGFIFDCPLVPGAVALLAALGGTPCHLVSGTPQDELLAIVATKGLRRYFATITGAPSNKAEVFAAILRAGGHAPASALAVGDSPVEWQAAQSAGLGFVGVVKPPLPDPFPTEVRIVADMLELGRLLGLPRLHWNAVP